MSQSWMIASGKGGVGKSLVAASLGIALARRQLPTVIVDTDIGLRSQDLLLGLQNKVVYDVVDVAHKDCKLRYALISHNRYPGLSLLPASQLGTPADLSAERLAKIVLKLKKRFAYVLLDAPAGLEGGLRAGIPAADHTLLVTTPDDVAIRDAERVVSLLESLQKPRPMLLVNRVDLALVRAGDMYAPQTVATTLDLPLLGYLPEDPRVQRELCRHESIMEEDGPTRQAMERVTRRFLGEFVPLPPMPRKRFFQRRRPAKEVSL